MNNQTQQTPQIKTALEMWDLLQEEKVESEKISAFLNIQIKGD